MRSEVFSRIHPFRYAPGYTDLRVASDELPRLLNLCLKLRIPYYEALSDGELGYVRLSFFAARRLKRALKNAGIEAVELGSWGIPALLLKHRARLGIPVGILLSLLILIFSSRVIWDVRIDGAQRLCDKEVIELLGQCGLSVGSETSSLEVSVIENRVMMLSRDIAWISINLRGTVANVEIRETSPRPVNEDPPAANLVSEVGGVIVRLEEVRGSAVVSPGETVGEGQLLVSGIIGSEDTGIAYTCADGRVFAECEESFSIEVPRSYTKKEYTGRVKCEKYLIFFKKEIKIFGNCGNLYENYDKIEVVEYLPALSGECLPIGIRTVTYSEYVYEDVERTDEELLSVAKYRQNASISLALRDAELLSKKESYNIDDSGITLTCKLRSIENIAKAQKIEIANLSSKK